MENRPRPAPFPALDSEWIGVLPTRVAQQVELMLANGS